jgi:hypothetical protein
MPAVCGSSRRSRRWPGSTSRPMSRDSVSDLRRRPSLRARAPAIASSLGWWAGEGEEASRGGWGSVGFVHVRTARALLSSACLRSWQRIGFGFGGALGLGRTSSWVPEGWRRRRPFSARRIRLVGWPGCAVPLTRRGQA